MFDYYVRREFEFASFVTLNKSSKSLGKHVAIRGYTNLYNSNIPLFRRCKFKYLNSVAKFEILGEHDLEEVTRAYLRTSANFKTYFYKIYERNFFPYVFVLISIQL